MKILSIDTTSEVCGVAILEDENLIVETSLTNGLTHSENLMPIVKEALEKTGITLKEIDLIACCTGPGSFTGIRIGVASVKAIAEVGHLKVAEVTSLESLAKNILENCEAKVSLIDARNNQCYCGVFDNEIHLKKEYMADDIHNILEKLKEYKGITFVGNGAELHKELILENFPNAKFSCENKQTAYSCGLVGLKKYRENQLKNADTLLPNYLRKSQAERLKKES
ncbi:MAG: tRNA (adenosine(37)-N6)-threonylcarbamoyltransferase complex dimerization subunit type 1 TsaB [Clostridia bacterium]|nr:tRNA (adenosine(37)-N6)-threonylcarbamoyltransferase complex dimerization subunit type 1 TsaB [Clostridia bacterium]